MAILQVICMPVVGALIGWITNRLAVMLIFRPYKPVRLLGYTFQGVVPKRRLELAEKIGAVIEKELLSMDDLVAMLRSKDVLSKIEESLINAIKIKVMEWVPSFLPASVRRAIVDSLAEQVRRHLPSLMDELIEKAGKSIQEQFHISTMVEEKINDFPMDRLEQLILSVSARELKHIEILGGILGFIIGWVQVGILFCFS